jgi:GTP-binding protein
MKNMQDPKKIRNLAIIAHIDHGKTTLLDALLRQSQVFRDNEEVAERAMDSFSLEKERGITIFAKHTSIYYQDYKINIIDTPGHADFSGEVERVLGMVNSAVLLIDAQEGPMPQTRFVLSLALKMGLKPIVILNKIDRPHANPDEALNKTFDLFVELGANDEQLDFAYAFASGLSGFATKKIDDPRVNMDPLFDLIVEQVPPPPGRLDLPFLMQVATVSYDDFVGRQAGGRILEGQLKKGDNFTLVASDGSHQNFKATRIEGYLGLKRVEMTEAGVGDIISISGAPEVMIGDTLCDTKNIVQLPPITLGKPTLSIDFMVNSGPFVGKDGKHVTMNKLRDRLLKEKKANITLQIDEIKDGKEEAVRVAGRGELHLSILIETLRREDYEFVFSKPQVIIREIDGVKCEPFETVHIDTPEEFSGTIIEELMRRRAEMRSLSTNEHGVTTLEFLMPSRGLMGYRNEFLTQTRGEGILTSVFHSYQPWKGEIPGRKTGSLISMCQGKATPYALFALQERGTLIVKPTQDVYEGMIVGEHTRANDLLVNVAKEKQLTNVRASGSDENVCLVPARVFTLEQAIDFIQDDELVEVTPKNIRLRKKYLKETDRKRR